MLSTMGYILGTLPEKNKTKKKINLQTKSRLQIFQVSVNILVNTGDIQKPFGHHPRQPALGGPA